MAILLPLAFIVSIEVTDIFFLTRGE